MFLIQLRNIPTRHITAVFSFSRKKENERPILKRSHTLSGEYQDLVEEAPGS
jgi:hypothetical protein